MNARHEGSGGFTLIELLVVISIISLIASIAVASLNQARTKAVNAKIVSELNQFKIAAALYYEEEGTYDKFCEDLNGAAGPIYTDLQNLTQWVVHCANGSNEWASAAYLVSDPPRTSYFCVDNSGTGKVIQGTFGSSDTWGACP